MPFVDVQGVRIHHRLDGPAGAPVVVLSNSLGSDLGMWDLQIPRLSRRLRVLRYDTRGHGQSAVPRGPYTLDDLGRDVLGLLDTLGVPRAHFCGLSMGGLTGQWLALRAPERIERLVLSDTAARVGAVDTWAARIGAVREGGVAAVTEAALSRFFTERFRARAPAVVERARAALIATPAEGYVASCEALRDADLRGEVERVRAPTLVVTGVHDPSTPPADGRFLAERIPGARYVELDAAHLANVEAADAFNDVVSEFLEGRGP